MDKDERKKNGRDPADPYEPCAAMTSLQSFLRRILTGPTLAPK
jgi:hypothetical protein